jgi:ADP-heptose:LPS heptosyltransferase
MASTKTLVLFGHTKERYKDMKFDELCSTRIADAKALHAKLFERISYDPNKQNKFQMWLTTRMMKIRDAIAVWEKILDEE